MEKVFRAWQLALTSFCQYGRWKSVGQGTNAYTAGWWSVGDTGWITNTSGRSQMIIASTDQQLRDCSIYGVTNTNGLVAQQFTAEYTYSSGCSISFMVPPGVQWHVSSGRFGGTPNQLTWVYTL